MKKLLLLLFLPILCYSQNSRWTDYFSYFNVKIITQANNLLFCASENGLFSYNEETGEVKKFSKANGLHEVKITAFSYNQPNNALIIGYKNGKMDIIKDNTIHLIIDIPFEQNYQGDKTINHIYTEGDYAILSMDFGISVFDLKRMEFKETCYFRNGANYYKVNKATILNNKIYAASSSGLYSHTIDGLIPNFPAWTVYRAGTNFTRVIKNNTTLIASVGNAITKSGDEGATWQNVGSYPNLTDLVSVKNTILFVQLNKITTLDQNFIVTNSTSYSDNLNSGYYSNGNLYAATQLKGILKGTSEYLAPDGPYNNQSYSLNIVDNQLWIAPGGRDNENNYGPVSYRYGYYHFDGSKWEHLSYENVNSESYIMSVIPNPSNLKETYVFSYANGLVKMVDNNFSIRYNHTNSAIKTTERLTGGGFDTNGNLVIVQAWAAETSNGVNNAIIIKTPNDQFNYLSLLPKRIDQAGGAMRPYIDPKGYVWVPSPRRNGLVVYKYNNTPLNTSDDAIYLIQNAENAGNLPSNNVMCATLDNSGTAWIGLDNGLRIFRNPYPSLQSGSYNTERIIVSQGGAGEEVLREVRINAIAVDGANRKWVGTHTSGVFYFSEDGKTTLAKFTVNDSPLPSNLITDIQIDKTGEVFFVTPLGVVSYRGDITNTGDEFGDIVAYPNPVRPGYTGNITIRGLAHDAYVKITDVAGNLVYETRAPGGLATWNGNNFNNKPVASGVYLVLMSNSDGSKHATTKIAIIR